MVLDGFDIYDTFWRFYWLHSKCIFRRRVEEKCYVSSLLSPNKIIPTTQTPPIDAHIPNEGMYLNCDSPKLIWPLKVYEISCRKIFYDTKQAPMGWNGEYPVRRCADAFSYAHSKGSNFNVIKTQK